jgi:hypothetical protein
LRDLVGYLSGCWKDEAGRMNLEMVDLPPTRVQPVNCPCDEDLVTRLAENMASGGWSERPLLVEEEARSLSHPQYFAWTGSHRIEAARRVGLSSVPCCLIRQADADAAFESIGFRLNDYSCWRDAIGQGRRDQEKRRLKALRAAGLEAAALMLQREMAATDGHAW